MTGSSASAESDVAATAVLGSDPSTTGRRRRVAAWMAIGAVLVGVGIAGSLLAGIGEWTQRDVLDPESAGPSGTRALTEILRERGVEVVVAGGGVNAALAGIVASHVTLPVIGVPIRGGGLGGLDALVAMTSMSAGVPVACVGLDHSTNAAILAVQILAVGDPGLRTQLVQFKETFEQAAVTTW